MIRKLNMEFFASASKMERGEESRNLQNLERLIKAKSQTQIQSSL